MKRILLSILLFTFFCCVVTFTAMRTPYHKQTCIAGVSLEAPRNPITINELRTVLEINSEWVAVIPYAFIDPDEPRVQFNHKHMWWGENEDSTIATISMAKELSLKIMLKPHVWVKGQGWAGDFEIKDKNHLKMWEDSYAEYILNYARVADSLHVEMLCIGTEFRKIATKNPDFWINLIKNVRNGFKGKITYAANWDTFDKISFWQHLDYIGIDAYFPVCKSKTPEPDDITDGWQSDKERLRKFSLKNNKQILFTEYGYRSIDYTAGGHWKHDENELSANEKGQANAYEGFYKALWHESWLAGGFLWKWHLEMPEKKDKIAKRFTPQEKPAKDVIREWYNVY